jgi:hypothetical protein
MPALEQLQHEALKDLFEYKRDKNQQLALNSVQIDDN